MSLAAILATSKADLPKPGTRGKEDGWLKFVTFGVSRGSLWAGDPYVANAEDGFMMEAPNGTYELEAKVMDFAGRKAVSRIRAYLANADEPRLGERIGETATDTGMLAVFDIKSLDAAIAGQNDAFQDEVMNHNFEYCAVIRINTGSSFDMPYIATAFGDCGGSVFELVSEHGRIGFEIELLPPGYVYEEED